MKVKEESEKVGLKLNIQKTKIMASGPITSWEVDGETVSDFIFLGSKITTDGDCSHESLGKGRKGLMLRARQEELQGIRKEPHPCGGCWEAGEGCDVWGGALCSVLDLSDTS